MTLSIEQIEDIRAHVESSEISSQLMRDDLIDHICCSVESKMKNGVSFQFALRSALAETAPRGFKEIETETYYLLHSTMIILKKISHGIMLLSSMSFCFGIAAKTLHLSFGNDFLLFGLAGLTMSIPFFAFKQNMSVSDGVRILASVVSLIFVTGGFTLKILQLAGADMFVVIGSCLFAIGFLPLYFIKQYRASLPI